MAQLAIVVKAHGMAVRAGVVDNDHVPDLEFGQQAVFAAGKYAIATHANGSLVGPPSAIAGATPATPGEVIAIYGTGFGPTSPAVDGLVLSSPASLITMPVIAIGGVSASVSFAGRSAAGLDQINVTVPPVPAGSTGALDLPIHATAAGSSSVTGLLINVQSGN